MLLSGAAVLGLAGVAVMAAAIALPVTVDAQAAAIDRPAPGGAPVNPSVDTPQPRPARDPLALPQLLRVASRDLRPPLFDPPPPPPTNDNAGDPSRPQPRQTLKIRLVGTVIEDDQAVGLFQASNNEMLVGMQGRGFDSPEGRVEVLKVELYQATVRLGGRTHQLSIPKPPPPPKPTPIR